MSRIETTFRDLKNEDRAALVTFVVAGDPDFDRSLEILKGLPEAGADIIELGMPFTDPMADGPAIQAAGQRALKAGADMKQTLKLVREFRKDDRETPLVLMGYFNPVLAYGPERFMNDAAEAGVDGMILVDLPPEEDGDIRPLAKEKNIDLIRLATPVTDDERLKIVTDNASGFLYYVLITGVTGAASANVEDAARDISRVRAISDLPVAAGFGIKTPDDAAAFGKVVDAVVVGSAIVQTVADCLESADMTDRVLDKVRALREAL